MEKRHVYKGTLEPEVINSVWNVVGYMAKEIKSDLENSSFKAKEVFPDIERVFDWLKELPKDTHSYWVISKTVFAESRKGK